MSQKGQENPNPMLTYLESKDPLENWKLIELTYLIKGCLSNANYAIDILIFNSNYFVLFIVFSIDCQTPTLANTT